MKKTLWTKNFTLLTTATVLGAAGGIASGFALSFLVYEETGSTFAAALLIAIQVVPSFIIPLLISPIMDRFPRKPFLVGGDLINCVLYALAGLYLIFYDFSYIVYLLFSLLLSSLGTFDSLAYNSIFPKLIPEGFEDKGYTVGGMVYPVMQVIMMPVAALLYKALGVGNILLIQAALSLLTALTENAIKIPEFVRLDGEKVSFKLWLNDIKAAILYLKNEKGLMNVFAYMAVTNGVNEGFGTLLIAYFSTAPGFTAAMYSFFAVAEFAGRTLGGLLHYNFKIPVKKRFAFAFFVYQTYNVMDSVLLWLPYPFMLANRAICGFLGINSATMRETAVQSYIPEEFRARINAFSGMLYSAAYCVLSLAIGALGEVLDYRTCFSVCGVTMILACFVTVWRRRKQVSALYNREPAAEAESAAAQ